MKSNKYEYSKVIQQNYGYGHGWEDVSEYETDSQYINREKSGSFRTDKQGRQVEISLIGYDLAQYRQTGYATRLINRRTAKKYMVKTETKGTLFFDELPTGTYFQEGYQTPEDKGNAMYFTNDNGTCLIPIYEIATGKQVVDINRAGQDIK